MGLYLLAGRYAEWSPQGDIRCLLRGKFERTRDASRANKSQQEDIERLLALYLCAFILLSEIKRMKDEI